MPKFCPSCGTALPEGVKFCPGCGQKLAAEPQPQAQPSFVPPVVPPVAPPGPAPSYPTSAPAPSAPPPQQAVPGPQPNQGSWQAAPAQQSYNAAQQSYNAAQQSYNTAQQGYNAAQQGYNAAQQGYRQPWQGYNQGQGAAQSPVPPQAYPQAVPKSGKSKLPLILIAIVAVLALAAVAAFLWPGFLKSSAPAPTAPVTEPANPADPTASTAATAATQTAVPTDVPVTTEAPVIGNPFTNVDEDDPHYGEYLWCYSQGIYPESSIDREAVLDRGNVITLLWRAAGSPAPQGTAQAFTDVSQDTYCYTPLLWALEQEIVSTADDAEFHHEASCSRGDALNFLLRYAQEDAASLPRAFADTDVSYNDYNCSNWGFAKGIVERGQDYCFHSGEDMLLGDWLCWLARLQQPFFALEPKTESTDGFEDYGITEYLTQVGGEMEFLAATKEDASVMKRLKITVEDYQVFDQSDLYEAREGYEWRVVTILIGYAEQGAEDYAYSLYAGFYDYYNGALYRDWYDASGSELGVSYVVMDDKLREVYVKPLSYETVDGALFRITEAVQVPWGYDGMVCVVNASNAQPDSDQSLQDVYADGSYHAMFRLQ